MNNLPQHYGYKNLDSYPLASWIWGHRLRGGQHWMEYLLEFLNVLAGFEYLLGQGLDGKGYSRFTRLGLRRFVFYDDREKTKHPYDEQAQKLLWSTLKEHISDSGIKSFEEGLILTQNLFRAFSAIEEDRSWYAKSLFPAHHNLLFWEALRRRGSKVETDKPLPQEIDRDISFTERNFFARGGEIYYLILSAGTEQFPERRAFIAQRIQSLLMNYNLTLGQIADLIDRSWLNLYSDSSDLDMVNSSTGGTTLGWLPDPNCPFYIRVAEDAATFLKSDLDSLECLDLFAHLIGFHMVQYIYHRAHPNIMSEHLPSNNCLDACRPLLLVDVLEDEEGSVLRKVSAALFREQENYQKKKAYAFVQKQVMALAADLTGHAKSIEALARRAEDFFNASRLSKLGKQGASQKRSDQTKQRYQRHLGNLQTQLDNGELNETAATHKYGEVLLEAMMDDFQDNFLSVHRKLAKSIGLVAPRKGPSGRFVLGDNLLKTLVLANVPPNEQITLGDLLSRLYERYGIIIGSGEAYQSGLFDRWRINTEYYDRNRTALQEKMLRAGLVIQYSDATTLVSRK